MTLLFLCVSCAEKEEIIGGVPYTPRYAVSLYFTDKEGKDVSDRLPFLPDSTTNGNGVSFYELPSDEFSWTLFIDGVEMLDSCLTGGVDPANGRPAYEQTEMKLIVTKGENDVSKRFSLFTYTFYFGYDTFWNDEWHTFDYRFRCPLLFGDRVNSLQIISRADFFQFGDFNRTVFNGKPVERRFQEFTIVVDGGQGFCSSFVSNNIGVVAN